MSQGVITYLRVSSAESASVHIPRGYRLTPMASTIDVLHVNSDRQGEDLFRLPCAWNNVII